MKNIFKIKEGRGITLIEVLVVVFIIALLSTILVGDFPKIRKQFALTRAVYRLSQDLRRTQDMSFSGQSISNLGIKSYGLYIDLNVLGNKKYIIYADRGTTPDNKYSLTTFDTYCSNIIQGYTGDCIIEMIDLSRVEPDVVISLLQNTNGQKVDINFEPPNPTITITSLVNASRVQILFALGSDLTKQRIVYVNTSGLIEIK